LAEDCTGGLAGRACEVIEFVDGWGDPAFAAGVCL
jgi:hypothetical protein